MSSPNKKSDCFKLFSMFLLKIQTTLTKLISLFTADNPARAELFQRVRASSYRMFFHNVLD